MITIRILYQKVKRMANRSFNKKAVVLSVTITTILCGVLFMSSLWNLVLFGIWQFLGQETGEVGNFQSASFMKDGKATPLKVYSQKETNFKAPEE